MRLNSLLSKLNLPSPLEPLSFTDSLPSGISIDIKRDDLIHPTLSGNKIRKLYGYLEQLKDNDYAGVVTMGGPWSNHLHACGWLCHELSIPMHAIVRGQKPANYSSTLTDLINWDVSLHFVSRADYRQLRDYYEEKQSAKPDLLEQFSDCLFIPEGGRAQDADIGMATLAQELSHDYDAVYLGVGTATTFACLMAHWTNPSTKFYGVLAVDAIASQQQTIEELAPQRANSFELISEYTFGGFAKTNNELEYFMLKVFSESQLLLEPVYTAKALFALDDHIKQGRHNTDARILFLHTGGLQGLRGYQKSSLAPLAKALPKP